MVLYKNLYLIPFLNSFFYIEGNLILLFSSLNIRKIKLNNYIILSNSFSQFFLYRSIFISPILFNTLFNNFFFFLNSFIFGSILGYSNAFRLIGRGYKVYININIFLFRLGYSHNIYYLLPLNIKGLTKSKLKKFWIIKGSNSLVLSKLVHSIRSFKIPNTYMYKGIYPKNKVSDYQLKSTKVGFL